VIALALALSLAAAPAPAPHADANDLGTRMRDSAAAAQVLQGPLDGSWTLSDEHGRALYMLQITDPVGGAGPLEGAWRTGGKTTAEGLIETIRRRSDFLTIQFLADGGVVRVHLRRRANGTWSGEANDKGRPLQVALRRTERNAAPP
jgi:hypothetical protein